jgi:hypothetical protein
MKRIFVNPLVSGEAAISGFGKRSIQSLVESEQATMDGCVRTNFLTF